MGCRTKFFKLLDIDEQNGSFSPFKCKFLRFSEVRDQKGEIGPSHCKFLRFSEVSACFSSLENTFPQFRALRPFPKLLNFANFCICKKSCICAKTNIPTKANASARQLRSEREDAPYSSVSSSIAQGRHHHLMRIKTRRAIQKHQDLITSRKSIFVVDFSRLSKRRNINKSVFTRCFTHLSAPFPTANRLSIA